MVSLGDVLRYGSDNGGRTVLADPRVDTVLQVCYALQTLGSVGSEMLKTTVS